MNTNSSETPNSNCAKAQLRSDKTQYGEGGFWAKFWLMVHLSYCKHCRHYSSFNYKLTKILNRAELKALQPGERESLKKQLEQEGF